MFWGKKKYELKKKEVDLEVAKYEADMQLKGNAQRNAYECEWHNEREARRVELAKLDAEIDAKRESREFYKQMTDEKDKQILYLQSIINNLTDALGGKLAEVCDGKKEY